MSEPRFVDCRCGHSKVAHSREGLAPQCVATGCNCLQYRPGNAPQRFTPNQPATPRPATAPTPQPPVSSQPTADQLIAAGKRSTRANTRNLTARIEEQLQRLTEQLREDRAKAEALAKANAQREAAMREVERLERELAAAKARLKGRPVAVSELPPRIEPAREAKPLVPCGRDRCDRTFETSQAAAMHRRRAHDGFDPFANRGTGAA